MIRRPSDEFLEHVKKYYQALPKTGEVYSRKTGLYVGNIRIREGGYMRRDAKPARAFTIVDIRKRKTIRAHVIWFLCMGDWPTKPVIHLNGIYTDDRLDNLQCGSVRGNTNRYLNKQLDKIENELNKLEQDAGKLCARSTSSSP